jgi:hypothetical protein
MAKTIKKKIAKTVIKKDKNISRYIIAAWKNAGARFGWSGEHVPAYGLFGNIPGFRLYQWTPGVISELPAPDQGFGLDLQDTSINDSGLKELAGFTHLQVLYLSRTLVTVAGIKALSKKLPALEVHT